MSQAREVVALAVGPVDAPVGRQVADALAAVAVPPSAARGVSRGLLAGIRAHRVLAALAARTHVAGVAGAHPALEGAVPMVALRAVDFDVPLAFAVTLRADQYFQGVPQPHRLYGKVSAPFLTVGDAHRHVEGCLEKKTPATCSLRVETGRI